MGGSGGGGEVLKKNSPAVFLPGFCLGGGGGGGPRALLQELKGVKVNLAPPCCFRKQSKNNEEQIIGAHNPHGQLHDLTWQPKSY